jgi:hypothetical protein
MACAVDGITFSLSEPESMVMTAYLPFDGPSPDDGETIDVSLKVGCVEIHRRIVAQWPLE